ncbi:serine/threonine protein kinase [Methanocella sp. CWC-04]|uniref:non-specific serine/threonine protein kinase n=1 Tax=Methanooceanicella nereidis TaxID=2052831 RepID=A0AAP2REA2_9EURY|nr:RIO1 family regulatory kinase/ATPase [Methanocella sp. CWC-04]MCD1294950.1 serine/threonine protein kinase [Methanocella sp. CWC-04]
MIDHAAVYRSLLPIEIEVMKGIENGMKTHEWVPVESIVSYTGLNQKEVEFRLKKLSKQELIEWLTLSYTGYRLKFNGYDILAINTFVKKDTIEALGNVIGVGKESVIIAAMSVTGEVAIKFHREGRTSFKQVKRTREHLINIEHYSWQYAAKLAANREFEAMQKLYPEVRIPQPIDYNRHAIVMSIVDGADLVRAQVADPEWYLDEILKQVKIAYDLGYIHGDLSEYNVMVSDKGITIIDWPQYVTVGSKTAESLLNRDISNILTYFERKYRVTRDLEETIKSIKGE